MLERNRRGVAARATVVYMALAGCYSSYRIETDGEARDVPDADVVRDVVAEDTAEDVVAAACPATLPTGEPGWLTRRWSVRVPGAWQANGSAGVAFRHGALLIVPPRPGGEAPWIYPFAESTGEPLRDPGDAVVGDMAGATAVAAIPGGEFSIFLAAASGSLISVGLRSDGEPIEASSVPVEWGGVMVTDLRAAGIGEPDDPIGLTAGGSIGREEPRLLALRWSPDEPVVMLSELGEELTGDVAASAFIAEADPFGFVVTAPIGRFAFWDPPRARPFDRPTPMAPISAAPEILSSAQLLLARRGVPPSPDDPMVVESWLPGEADPVDRHLLIELEGWVDRPYPREFAGGDRSPALAWVAHDGGTALRPACLYVTPLDPGGGPKGESVRADEDGDAPSATTPEYVRLISDRKSLFVVWRCATDLCVVDLEWPS